MVDILKTVQQISQIGMSTKEKQSRINVSEVWYTWDILQVKYDAIEIANILKNMARDKDLQVVINVLLKLYKQVAKEMEIILKEYAVVMPERPPERAESVLNVEIISDRYIFNTMYEIVQGILPVATTSYSRAISPEIRNHFRKTLFLNIDVFEKLIEYGKLKGYLVKPPVYKT